MRLGTRTAPGTFGVVSLPGGHAVFHAPEQGAILYRYGRGAFPPPVPVRVPAQQRQLVPVRVPSSWDPRMIEALARTASGAALLVILGRAAERIARLPGLLFMPDSVLDLPGQKLQDDKA